MWDANVLRRCTDRASVCVTGAGPVCSLLPGKVGQCALSQRNRPIIGSTLVSTLLCSVSSLFLGCAHPIPSSVVPSPVVLSLPGSVYPLPGCAVPSPVARFPPQLRCPLPSCTRPLLGYTHSLLSHPWLCCSLPDCVVPSPAALFPPWICSFWE